MNVEDILVNAVLVGPKHRAVVPETVAEIAKSIKEIGLTHPIAVRRLEGGRPYLIAGRQRLEAHKKLKRKTIQAIVFDDEDIKAKRREHHENLCRHNLSPAQEALAHHELKQLHEADYQETKRGGAPGAGRGRGKKPRLEKGQNGPLVSYTADASKKTGKSQRTTKRQVRRAEILGGQLEKLVNTSVDAPEQLDALVELVVVDSTLADGLVEKAAAGEKVDAKTELKKFKRIQRERELAEQIEAAAKVLGEQIYGVILADPPWSRETWSEAGKSRDPANHYPTESVEKLSDLEIPAADDCVLFLWSTQEHLDQALSLIDAWGFEYKSGAVWVKPRVGTGYWFRTKHELLLVATKGDPVAPAQGTQIDSVFEAPVGRHSEKPAIVHEMIDRMWPETPKLEMFARAAREGWDLWGAEAPL